MRFRATGLNAANESRHTGRVPDILLSGNHAKIREWQEKVAYERTKTLRPDLLGEQGDF